jgi:hypothetical protein
MPPESGGKKGVETTDLTSYRERKQAVVFIHGIGEQRPMKTLRQFVEAVLINPDKPYLPKYWSKPDEFSESFELRRLSAPRRRDRPRTDFFEFYWQHLMQGNRLSHVRRWIVSLLWRAPKDVPEHLKSLWWFSWIVVFVVMGLWIWGGAETWVKGVKEGYLGPVIGIFVLVGQGFLLGYIADAARYLDPAPANIPVRHKIRAAGVALLKELHKRGRYNRIIVVGHSLGSVIGYDILYHCWIDYHDRHSSPDQPVHDVLKKLERASRDVAQGKDANLSEFQELQRDYGFELLKQGNPWLVTDFITLGSPLAHAELLLVERKEEFSDRIQRREFPTCPPMLEYGKVFSFRKNYSITRERGGKEVEEPRTIRVPHHAACFAPVRWTNIYFPSRFFLFGDIIGGPLRDTRRPVIQRFGFGVRDLTVKTWARLGLFSHTRYWGDHPRNMNVQNAPLKVLREALALDDRREWEKHLLTDNDITKGG